MAAPTMAAARRSSIGLLLTSKGAAGITLLVDQATAGLSRITLAGLITARPTSSIMDARANSLGMSIQNMGG